jgi:hypothetical protein
MPGLSEAFQGIIYNPCNMASVALISSAVMGLYICYITAKRTRIANPMNVHCIFEPYLQPVHGSEL